MISSSVSTAEFSDHKPISLVPSPQKMEFQSGTYTPQPNLVLRHEQDHTELEKIANTFCENLSNLGFSSDRGHNTSTSQTSTINLTIQEDCGLGQEEYRLGIDSDISILASTSDGLFWGTRTLLQILHAGPFQEVPRLRIEDHPEFDYRGVMIDTAREFHSLDFHIDHIKRLASFKINRYQIHFSDHQSYTLPSHRFPAIPTAGRHYTVEQLQKLVEIADHYHVAIVPEIDVPGHASALVRGHRELGCENTPPDEFADKLCIGSENTYDTLEKLFSEIMEILPGEYWHLGADEVAYQDRENCRCNDCRQKMKREKLDDGYQLYHYFINRMHEFVRGTGRQMLVWEGFKPTGQPSIPEDVVVCPFDVKHEGHMPGDYMDAGYRVLNTSWTPLYIADKIYMTTPEILARWSPCMLGAGRSPQPLAYWHRFEPDDYRDSIIGAQMCSWANEERAEEGLFFGTGPGFPNYGRPAPRLQIMAERLWTGNTTSSKNLLERVGADYW